MPDSVNGLSVHEVSIEENFEFQCRFLVKEGKPDRKMCTMQVIEILPTGKEKSIATTVLINLSMHFGEAYSEQICRMEPASANQEASPGIIVDSLRYRVLMASKSQKDEDLLN